MSEDNKEVLLQIEDALTLGKLLHRVIFDAATIKQVDEKQKYILLDIKGIKMSSDEISRLKTVAQLTDDLVRQHREQARKDLEALGERLYMDGDGILMVEPLVGPMEYRVFAQTVSGTSYLGAFPTEAQAKAAWHDRTKKPVEDVDLYKYMLQIDEEWELVQWAEFTAEDCIENCLCNHDVLHTSQGGGTNIHCPIHGVGTIEIDLDVKLPEILQDEP